MDADNEKLVQELMQNWLVDYLPDNGVLMNAKLMLREAISRTQEATRMETLLEAAEVCDKSFGECNARPNCHSLDAANIRKLAEAPTKPSLEVK